MATTRMIDAIAAALRDYGICDADMVNAIRTVHGFAMLHPADGLQRSAEPSATVDWMTQFIDRGLRADRPSTENAADLLQQRFVIW